VTTSILENSPEKAKHPALQWIALFSIIFATFLEMLDGSLMNVALPKLINVFDSTTEDIEWVTIGYTLATAVVIPLGGFLADRFGYKRTMLLSVTAFITLSALCGFAWNDISLVIFRVLQGLGGGFIMPVGMAMLYQIMDRSKIQIAFGIWGISAMAAPALGPTVGGYIIDHLHWSFLFFINVPVGLLSLLIGVFLLKETVKRPELKFDFPGIILSAIFFSTLLLAFTKGESKGWTSLYIVSLLFVSVFSLILLLWVETGKENPVINLRLFKNRDFTISTLISCVVFVSVQGGAFLLPMWYQNVQSLTPQQTGMELMPQAIAMGIMMPIAGALSNKFGVIPVGILGLFIATFATYELYGITSDIPSSTMNLYLLIRGVGFGLCIMPIMTAGLNTLSNELMGSASSLGSILRNATSAFGIAILTSFMSHRTTLYGVRIKELVTEASPAYAAFHDNVVNRYMALGTDIPSAEGGATGLLAQLIQTEAYVRGMTDTFFVLVIIGAICIPFVLFMKNKSSREDGDEMMIH
jgi:EmrB/QacA subfamily drug resistance transporter